jgi:tetratricopeptide (TPR) repeat protein
LQIRFVHWKSFLVSLNPRLVNSSARQAEANALTLAGIAQMEAGQWRSALEKFDAAIALRESMDWQNEPLVAWGLAAGWLNRGDALYFSGKTGESLASLDRAIEVMAVLPLAENAAYVDRLLLAWINRGTRAGEFGRNDLAEVSFAAAQALFEAWGRETHDARRLLVAMFHGNRARWCLSKGEPAVALADARLAIRVLTPVSLERPEVARAAVLARGVICRVLAALLEMPDGAELSSDWIAEATDATEEALALVKRHGFVGELVADLVRYGALIYRTCQPQFLGEFVCEWLSVNALWGDASLRQEMLGSLQFARAQAEARLLGAPHDDDHVARQTRLIRGLLAAEAALKSAHEKATGP